MSFRLLFTSFIALTMLSLYAAESNNGFVDTEVDAVAVETPVKVDTTGMSQHIVITGTFQTQASADSQLAVLAERLSKNTEISALKAAYGFDYVSRPSGDYFVVAIEPIYGRDTLNKVLTAAREIFKDAYEYVRSTKKTEIPEVKEEVAVVVVEKSEPALVVKEESAPVVTEKTEPVMAVVPEPQKEEEKVAVTTSAPVIIPEVKEVKQPTVKPASAPAEESSVGIVDIVIYAGIAIVVLLLVIVMMKRSKKEKPAAQQAPAETAEETPVATEETTAISEAEPIAVEEEPIEEIEEVAVEPEAPIEEEPVVEAEEPVTSEAVEETGAEAVEEVVEPTEPSAVSMRKKREPKAGRGKISKEDLAEFGGNRILVAEDNMINQKVLTSLLADSGIEVVIANDGQEAIDTLASDPDFQMILMDAHMPVKDGFEASREIRSNSAYDAIPIVALSGDVAADDLRAMAEAGMEEQLAKPIKLEELYDVMYCYFDIEAEEGEHELEDIELLPDTDELHAEDGLEISGGDEALYKEILNEFVQMYGQSDELLHNYLVHDDREAANAMLLDVHGIAANIGANRLAETSDALREAMIEGDEPKYTPLYEEYCKHLKKLLSDIEKI